LTRIALVALAALAVLVMPAPAQAHVGSPVVVQQGEAGPYRLLVTVRPPEVIPGRAAIDVRVEAGDVDHVTIVPLPLVGHGAGTAPVADDAVRSPADARLFSGTLWLMRTGTWQVRVRADGPRGAGTLAVPVPALAHTVRSMSKGLGVLLFALLALLVTGAVTIVGAGAREADLAPGAVADRPRVRRGRVAMLISAGVLVLALLGGRSWWRAEAATYRRFVYRPLGVTTSLDAGAGILRLTLEEPGWLRMRRLDDLLPDHGHLMHLFLIREADAGVVAHLHPARVAPGRFEQALPALPPGPYRLFGDVVHATGLDETVTARLEVPTATVQASPPSGDDAVGETRPAATAAQPTFAFAGGGGLRWVDPRPLQAGAGLILGFERRGEDGRPADLEPYMGMAGHAVFLADDFSVFAHVHPTGSVPMAALELASVDGARAPAHVHHATALPPRLEFPYVFPRAGRYRLFVQTKRNGRIDTAAFDLIVE
jgi:hypothetical protein